MSEKILKAIYTGNLKIGDTSIPCAVLENGTRVISKSAIFRSFGRTKRGRMKGEIRVPNMPSFIDSNNLQPFINEDLRGVLNPLTYRYENKTPVAGYDAIILPLICDVYLEARDKHVLKPQQMHLARQAEILIRSLSKIGIIALIDEATGYQEVRDRLALQKILEKYISKELLSWAKRFPDEFYKQMFRLRGWQYKPLSVKRPGVVGRLTNNIIYERLAPGVLEELKRRTPKDEKGRRKHHFHRLLTDDVGHPKLAEHHSAVIALMKASSTWGGFYRLIQRALPKLGTTLPLPFDEDNEREN